MAQTAKDLGFVSSEDGEYVVFGTGAVTEQGTSEWSKPMKRSLRSGIGAAE